MCPELDIPPLPLSLSQPARKRHKSAHAALSPPPIASLSTPTLNPPVRTPGPPMGGPVIVPNEKSLRRKQATSEQSSLVGVTLRPEKQAVQSLRTTPPAPSSSKGQSSPQTRTHSPSQPSTGPLPSTTGPLSSTTGPLSSTMSFSPVLPPLASSILSSITFTAPPFPSQPVSPDHSKQSSTPPAGMASRPVPSFTPTFHASNVRT